MSLTTEAARHDADIVALGRPARLNGWARLSVESSRAVLDELFLPAVEDRGLQAQLIAELRASGRRLLFRRIVLPLLLHEGERLLHFQLNRNTR